MCGYIYIYIYTHVYTYIIFFSVLQAIFSPGASLVVQMVRSLSAMEETGSVPGLGRSLEKEVSTHSSILAWRIPWTEEPGRLQSMQFQRVRHD